MATCSDTTLETASARFHASLDRYRAALATLVDSETNGALVAALTASIPYGRIQSTLDARQHFAEPWAAWATESRVSADLLDYERAVEQFVKEALRLVERASRPSSPY